MGKSELTKVVYFDEQTALDYVEIRDKGHYLREVEQVYDGKTGVDTAVTAKTPKLLSMFRLSADIHASAEAERIVKSTVSNTILTDFIERADKDSSIMRLSGYSIRLTEEARIAIYTAITDAANGSLPMGDQHEMGMEVSKFGSVLKNLQGYLECYAVKDGEISAMLRFNRESFRNNYQPADAINMDMHYYGVRVGKTGFSTMKSLGLDLTKTASPQGEINRLLESSGSEADDSSKELDVYDIILAGVFNNAAE